MSISVDFKISFVFKVSKRKIIRFIDLGVNKHFILNTRFISCIFHSMKTNSLKFETYFF